MNERLNQLHVEAARYAKEKYPSDIVEWSLCVSEKFAQLIVEECIKLNGKELAMPGHSRMVDVYCEHFGIEL